MDGCIGAAFVDLLRHCGAFTRYSFTFRFSLSPDLRARKALGKNWTGCKVLAKRSLIWSRKRLLIFRQSQESQTSVRFLVGKMKSKGLYYIVVFFWRVKSGAFFLTFATVSTADIKNFSSIRCFRYHCRKHIEKQEVSTFMIIIFSTFVAVSFAEVFVFVVSLLGFVLSWTKSRRFLQICHKTIVVLFQRGSWRVCGDWGAERIVCLRKIDWFHR